jgi:DNA-directed RNA polymerase
MTKSKNTYEAQRALENAMVLRGQERYKKRQETLRASQQETPHDLISEALPKVADAIRKAIANEEARFTSGQGKPSFWFDELREHCPETLAYIGLNVCYDTVIYGQTLTSALVAIGTRVEHERWAIDLETKDKVLFKRLVKQVTKAHSSDRHRFKAARIIAAKEGFSFNGWTKNARVSLASPILNAILEAVDIFMVESSTVEMKTMRNITLTPEAELLVRERSFDASWAEPMFGPLVVPPKPWVAFDTGVYENEVLAALTPLVRKSTSEQRKAIKRDFERFGEPQYVTALNALQATPLKVNTQIVDVIKWVRDGGLRYEGFPELVPPPYPQMPEDETKHNEEYIHQLRKDRKQWFIKKRECVTNVAVLQEDLKTADYLSCFDNHWLGWSFDFRGRMYPVSGSWNYHRADHLKACFLLGNGKKLDDTSNAWLLIQLANVGDFDKISKQSLDARIDWVHANEDMILSCADDYQATFDIWKTADHPLQFLAACFEYRKMIDQGDDYVCHLPISMDGTNSGTQHYALALKHMDGAMVNLVPSDKCQDVYAVVAKVVNRMLKEDGSPEAKRWLDYGVDRSTVKKNCMCYGYSSIALGMGYQITDDIMEPLQTQVNYGTLPGLILGEIQSNHPFGDYKSQGHHARFLANINYKAIKKTLSSVAMGMKFLQSYADALAREGKSCRWTSPSGFPVVMRYTKSTAKRVKIFLYDREAKMRNQTRINLKVDTDVADTRKSRSAVAANYVHSLDAAHMNLSILAGLDNHISDYFMIHDSFATTCHDTWKFWHCIRQTMVEIYEDNCVLGNFESECRQRLSNPDQDLEPVPEKGELIVADLVKSDYCFS